MADSNNRQNVSQLLDEVYSENKTEPTVSSNPFNTKMSLSERIAQSMHEDLADGKIDEIDEQYKDINLDHFTQQTKQEEKEEPTENTEQESTTEVEPEQQEQEEQLPAAEQTVADDVGVTEQPIETEEEDSYDRNIPQSVKKSDHWKRLKSETKKFKSLAITSQNRVADLEQTLQKQQQLPSDYEDLKIRSALYDLVTDNSFLAQYDNKIQDNENKIYGILKKYSVDDNSINILKEIGGVLSKNLPADFWQDQILKNMTIYDSELVKKLMLDTYETSNGKKDFLQSIPNKKQELVSFLDRKQQEKYSREIEEIDRHANDIVRNNNIDQFLKFVPIPEKSKNPQEIDRAIEHNKAVQENKELYGLAVKAKSPEERATVAVTATMAHIYAKQNVSLKQQLQTIQNENQRLTNELSKYTTIANKVNKASRMPSTAGKFRPTPRDENTDEELDDKGAIYNPEYVRRSFKDIIGNV